MRARTSTIRLTVHSGPGAPSDPSIWTIYCRTWSRTEPIQVTAFARSAGGLCAETLSCPPRPWANGRYGRCPKTSRLARKHARGQYLREWTVAFHPRPVSVQMQQGVVISPAIRPIDATAMGEQSGVRGPGDGSRWRPDVARWVGMDTPRYTRCPLQSGV